MAIGPNNGVAKEVLNFSEGGCAGLNHLPGQIISIHHLHAAITQNLRRRGFAHAHATSQTADFHGQNYGPPTVR